MAYATSEDDSGGAQLESFARPALDAYELPIPVSLRSLATGLNATFEVRAGAARYVLRVHRVGYRTPAHIRSELTFLREISDDLAGDPAVPVPVPARGGELVVAAEHGGERRWCDLLTCPLLGNLAGYPGAIPHNPAYPRLRDAFLAGYRSVRSLAVEWEKYLPLLMAARNANHCLLTARPDVSPTPADDAAWRMRLARRCLDLPV